MTVQYCENCGKPLNSRARFCGRCGKPVPTQAPVPAQPPPSSPPVMQPPPPAPPAYQPAQVQRPAPAPQPVASPQSGELIVAALPTGTQRSGFLGVRAEGFILVLTNMRILVAQQTAELMKENARQAKAAAKQSGKGFFGQWGAVVGSYGGQRYMTMQPQEILNETAGNYFIANNQIRSVRLKEKYEPEEGISEVEMTLIAGGSKLELTFNQTRKKHIKQILQQTLGNLVR